MSSYTEEPPRAVVANLELPASLEQYRPEFAEALGGADLAAWPEGDTFVDAEGHGPDRVRRAVKEILHPHLPPLRFATVWRDDLRVRGQRAYAAISRAGGKLAFFARLDVILEVDWALWAELSGAQRLAVIDHELHHLGWNVDKDRLEMVGHDVEEFGGIIRRWGLWRPALVSFARPMAEQLSLLPDYLQGEAEADRGPTKTAEEVSSSLRLLKSKAGPSRPTAGSKRGGKAARGRSKARNPFEPEEETLETAAAVAEAPGAPE